jgi:hypothetical protein
MGRIAYLRRIFSAYLTNKNSQLTFWHGEPMVNQDFEPGRLGEYYMPFVAKANYPGHYDENGIPMLDYHGAVGLQYNPIAIAQYGLGNYNLYRRTGDESRRAKFINIADWLARNLEETRHGTRVWNHHFDWEYRDRLKAPWYSALSQGQGVSLLVRAHEETGNDKYLRAAREAFDTFKKDIGAGGVTYTDPKNDIWFEETLVDPPTHILNGFIWATWGVYDYYLHTGDSEAESLYGDAVKTLRDNLRRFDTDFWSLYEHSGTRMKMLASPFYHGLHIAQLKVMHKLTGEPIFYQFANKWNSYRENTVKKLYAIAYKALFKILYY